MAYGSQFHMPGSFTFEGPGAPTTLNANMFRPPVSPTTSSYNLSRSTGSLLSDQSMATNSTTPVPRLGRKRTYDESNYRARGFLSLNVDSACDPAMEDGVGGEHRYTLAGQIETPGAHTSPQGGTLEDSLYSDIDYRRALGSKRAHAESNGEPLGLTGLVNTETGEPVTPRSAGWTTFAFQAIGGVVEKVWEFCRGGAGAFRGFQAGGGKAYEFNGLEVPVLTAAPGPQTIHDDPHDRPSSPTRVLAEDNGMTYFPNSSAADVHNHNLFIQDQQEKEPSPDTTPERPAAKRRQTGVHNENDELRRNWVMVDDEDGPSATPSRPIPKRAFVAPSRIPGSRASMATRLQQPRVSTPNASGRKFSAPSPRFSGDRSNIPTRASSRMSTASGASGASYAGLAASPSLGPGEPASFASPRSPSRATPANPFASNLSTPNGSRIPQPRGLGPNPFANTRTSSPVPQGVSPRRPSTRSSSHHTSPSAHSFGFNATPTGHKKTTSSASTGATRGRYSYGPNDIDKVQTSPRLDDEGRHLANKRFVTQRRADSTLDRLNMDLQGLIRQGQEALGATFDVNMDDGWEEDT